MIPYVSELPKAGWIDSASLSQVVDYFDHQYNASSKYPWSLRTVVDLTVLFALTEHQQLAPSTVQTGMAQNHHWTLAERLLKSGMVKSMSVAQTIRDYGRDTAQDWANSVEGLRSLRSATAQLLQDTTNFGPWIDWVIESGALSTHVATHKSLIDKHTTEIVGMVLNKAPSELADLQKRARSPSFVGSIKSGSRSTEANEVIAGYMCSNLLRGRAHAHMAVSEGVQLTPHPFREGVLGDTVENAESTPTLLSVSNTVERLAQYIIAIAGQQRSTDARLASWVESIGKVRASLRVSSALQLSEQSTVNTLERNVLDFLKRADIVYGSRTLPTTVDLGYAVGIGCLAYMFVQYIEIAQYLGHAPEIAMVAGAATLANRMRLAERTSEKVTYLTEKNLLESGAGILRRQWSDEGRLSFHGDDA